MFRISLKNVGPDMINGDMTTEAKTNEYALYEAIKICNGLLGGGFVSLDTLDNSECAVMQNGSQVGSLTVTDLG